MIVNLYINRVQISLSKIYVFFLFFNQMIACFGISLTIFSMYLYSEIIVAWLGSVLGANSRIHYVYIDFPPLDCIFIFVLVSS